jgi:hypothetical protein
MHLPSGRWQKPSECELLDGLHQQLIDSRVFYQELQQRKESFKVTAAVQVAGADVDCIDGLCIVYTLITLVSIETRATVTNLLHSLNTLHTIMDKVKIGHQGV